MSVHLILGYAVQRLAIIIKKLFNHCSLLQLYSWLVLDSPSDCSIRVHRSLYYQELIILLTLGITLKDIMLVTFYYGLIL